MDKQQDTNESLAKARLNQLSALSAVESVTMLAGKLIVQDAFGRTYTYLGSPADITPDDIVQMQSNPPEDQNRILRNIDDLRVWRANHGLDPNGYSTEKKPKPRGRASRKMRIARANAKRK